MVEPVLVIVNVPLLFGSAAEASVAVIVTVDVGSPLSITFMFMSSLSAKFVLQHSVVSLHPEYDSQHLM